VPRHRELLEVLGSVVYVGNRGTGYATKLLVNLLRFGQAVATGEALLLARRSGIDLESIGSAVNGSSAANEFLRGNLTRLLEIAFLEERAGIRLRDVTP
jgi:3-hydroxyisobutyrate dehydrogenase